jgi:hypothetical protein
MANSTPLRPYRTAVRPPGLSDPGASAYHRPSCAPGAVPLRRLRRLRRGGPRRCGALGPAEISEEMNDMAHDKKQHARTWYSWHCIRYLIISISQETLEPSPWSPECAVWSLLRGTRRLPKRFLHTCLKCKESLSTSEGKQAPRETYNDCPSVFLSHLVT